MSKTLYPSSDLPPQRTHSATAAKTPLLFNSREAAAELRISERTLWSLTDQGIIPAVRIGRSVRYDPRSLSRWIERQQQSAVAEPEAGELAAAFPVHVVCAWLGNTEAVAKAHYLQVTQSDFDKAAAVPTAPPTPAAPQAQAAGENAAEKAVQNPVQQPAEQTRTLSHGVTADAELQGISTQCEVMRGEQWPLSESNRYALSGNGF